jgi:CheY-like chemotaxis protein
MKPVILCVEDESEVRDAVIRDLSEFEPFFRIEETEDVPEAREVVDALLAAGEPLALILCDHVLPGENGVEFLISLNQREDTQGIRKVLLTGQAGHEDTIRAINQAKLDHYLSKPWGKDELVQTVREQLTEYVLSREESLMPYVQILDGPRLMEAMSTRQPGW